MAHMSACQYGWREGRPVALSAPGLAPVLRQVTEKRRNIPIAPDYAERMIL
jgi:hypothetical protein